MIDSASFHSTSFLYFRVLSLVKMTFARPRRLPQESLLMARARLSDQQPVLLLPRHFVVVADSFFAIPVPIPNFDSRRRSTLTRPILEAISVASLSIRGFCYARRSLQSPNHSLKRQVELKHCCFELEFDQQEQLLLYSTSLPNSS